MPNVVVLAEDERVRKQVEQFLGQLGTDELRVGSFSTFVDFKAVYKRVADNAKKAAAAEAKKLEGEAKLKESDARAAEEAAKSPPPEGAAKPTETAKPAEPPKPATPEPAAAAKDPRHFDQVHLIIYAINSLGEKSNPWLDKIEKTLKELNCWPQGGRTRLVMLKYEDDGVSKLSIIHPMLDDLIYLPMDRLVFLQKIQILLALPKRATPSFLFNQEVQIDVEISKITKLERLSDVGIAIRNPVPLKKGTAGQFYINFTEEKALVEIRAKVIRSEVHPEYPDQYLVYFSYFGISKTTLSTIRKVLTKAPRYQSLMKQDRELFRPPKEEVLLSDDMVPDTKGVAVVDSDPFFARSMAESIGKDMDKLDVISDSSLSVFLHKYLDTKANEEKTPPKITEESDFYANPIKLKINTPELKCVAAEPAPAEEQMFLGFPALNVFMSPERWFSLIQDKESRLIVEEAASLVMQGRVLNKTVIIQDAENNRRAVNLKMSKGSAENEMLVEMAPATLEDVMQLATPAPPAIRLKSLVLDSAFVPAEPAGWFEGIRGRAVQQQHCSQPSELKFFIIGDNEGRFSPAWLNSPDVSGFFVRPVDNRQFMFLLSESLKNKHTVYNFDNLGWSQPNLNVHVSKPIRLEAISEYGARLRSSAPILPGTLFYLRKSIFDSAPNACLAARVYSCEQDPNDKTSYQIYVIYFGIGDTFLKYARTWIRDNYAQMKAQAGGGN